MFAYFTPELAHEATFEENSTTRTTLGLQFQIDDYLQNCTIGFTNQM